MRRLACVGRLTRSIRLCVQVTGNGNMIDAQSGSNTVTLNSNVLINSNSNTARRPAASLSVRLACLTPPHSQITGSSNTFVGSNSNTLHGSNDVVTGAQSQTYNVDSASLPALSG